MHWSLVHLDVQRPRARVVEVHVHVVVLRCDRCCLDVVRSVGVVCVYVCLVVREDDGGDDLAWEGRASRWRFGEIDVDIFVFRIWVQPFVVFNRLFRCCCHLQRQRG